MLVSISQAFYLTKISAQTVGPHKAYGQSASSLSFFLLHVWEPCPGEQNALEGHTWLHAHTMATSAPRTPTRLSRALRRCSVRKKLPMKSIPAILQASYAESRHSRLVSLRFRRGSLTFLNCCKSLSSCHGSSFGEHSFCGRTW